MTYDLMMVVPNEEDVRRNLKDFLTRKGHGWIVRVADVASVSRQTVSRFRDGENAEDSTVIRIDNAVNTLRANSVDGESAPESGESRQQTNRDMFRGVLASDPRAIIAAKLYAAADTLMAPDLFDDDSAFNGLMDTVKYVFENRDSILSAIRKAKKGGE